MLSQLHISESKSALLFNFRKFDFMDVMLQKLEKYAYHLESQVKERTAALEDEKRKTDMLLYRMLPPLVVISTSHKKQ
jgi:nitrate/nitrite-specific signal transduction histidine kinase